MDKNHRAASIPEALNIEDTFLTYYMFFMLQSVLEELPDMTSFSKETEIYIDADEAFWGMYPKLYEAMNRKEHSTIFYIGAKKASNFIEDHITDQASYDNAILSTARNVKRALNEYKENK